MPFFRGAESGRVDTGVIPRSDREEQWLKQRLQLMNNIVLKGRIRPIGKLKQVIERELVNPRTVFVTPLEQFERDWKVFEKVMKLMPAWSSASGVKFYGSKRKDSETVGLRPEWHICSGYDEHTFGNYMWLRGEALMESGIYGVWKQWDDLRKVFNGPAHVHEDLVTLSFGNSDLHLHFYLYFVALSIAFLALLAEVLVGYFKSFFAKHRLL